MTPAVRARDGAAGESFLHGRSPLIAIVRLAAGGALADVVRALAAGGIELTEITIDTPGALTAVEAAVAEGHTVGVGTDGDRRTGASERSCRSVVRRESWAGRPK